MGADGWATHGSTWSEFLASTAEPSRAAPATRRPTSVCSASTCLRHGRHVDIGPGGVGRRAVCALWAEYQGNGVYDLAGSYYGVWGNRVVLQGSDRTVVVSDLDLRSAFGFPSHGFTVAVVNR